jgi:serine/threonine protein kinase
MMYQCLTGTLPFEEFRKDKLAAIFKTARERPEPPRTRAPHLDIPVEVEALVMRAMEIDVDRRFASVADLAAAIRSTLRSSHGSGPDSIPEITPSATGRGVEVTQLAASSQAAASSRSGEATPAVSTTAGPVATAERGTPLPPGVVPPAKPAEEPTAPHPAEPQPSRVPIVIAALMLAGLLAIVALILVESLRRPQTSTERTTPTTPR